MADRLSQEAVEALYLTTAAKARVSQEAIEVVYETSATTARVSQVAVEVLEKIHTVSDRLSQLAVEVLTTPRHVDPSFIASATVVHTLALIGDEAVPFIASATVVYAPTLSAASTEVDVPFIASKTRVYGIFSLYLDRLLIGAGNGGEVFTVELAPNGTTVTATLTAAISPASTTLNVSGDSGLPATKPFALAIDDEILYVVRASVGHYRIAARGLSNTAVASHVAGASATWGDSYDMAIAAGADIAHQFTADIESSGSTVYPGWLICYDSSQAYLAGVRYPMHVTSLLGVFDAGAGSSGSNRCDAAQPNAIAAPTGVSDDCPASLSNPSRIQADILIGDVAVVRYQNPEASALDLGPRSTSLQSWFGLKRVSTADVDVTLTDPNGIVVDTTGTYDTFTGSVDGEWFEPSAVGIAPSTGDATTTAVPYTSVTLLGADRFFTYGPPGYSEKGWPIGCLAVRQGPRRVPFWQSYDWHDFSYVYSGFGTDDTFCQVVINRNGVLFGPLPEVDLPGPQDIHGPDAVWDDGTYYFGACWYVALFSTPYLVLGPSIGGTLGGVTSGFMPTVTFAGTLTPSILLPTVPVIEGGSGGDISPAGGLHVWQRI